jgi:hypothetical protein
MSSSKKPITIPPELGAEMTAAVRDDVAGSDCATGGGAEDAAALLVAAEHTTSAQPAAGAETQVEEETWRAARPQETRVALDSHRRVRRRASAAPDRVPALRGEALRQRPGAAAAPGWGIARDHTDGDRVPTAPVDVPLLRRNDVCGIARGRGATVARASGQGRQLPSRCLYAYVAGDEQTLIDVRLYLSKEWTKNKRRCRQAGVPKEIKFRTRHELALEMIRKHRATLPHAWVTGDDEMGRNGGFRDELRTMQEQYLLAVPSNTLVHDLDAVRPPYSGAGAPPKVPFQRADGWMKTAKQWARRDVGDLPGAAGPKSGEARLRLVERAVRDAVAGVRARARRGASGGRMPSACQGRIGLGGVSSANVARLASSSNAHLDRDMVLDAREAAGGRRSPHASRSRRYVTSLANCCMTNCRATRCVTGATAPRDFTVENKPHTSTTGRNTTACHH